MCTSNDQPGGETSTGRLTSYFTYFSCTIYTALADPKGASWSKFFQFSPKFLPNNMLEPPSEKALIRHFTVYIIGN